MTVVEVWGDGSCKNTGAKNTSMGIGIVIKVGDKVVKEIAEFVGYGTSSLSEWEALITGLREAVKLTYNIPEPVEIRYYADSQMVVKQFNGEYSNKNFKQEFERAKYWMGCMRCMDRLIVKWVARDKNKHADALSKEGNPFKTRRR